MQTATAFRSVSFPRPPTVICPDCLGRGYETVEITERGAIWPEYQVEVPVVCYRTKPCRRCHGRGLVVEEN